MVLDCGCGHAATSIYLALNYRVNVVGITLSPEQAIEAKRLVRLAKVEKRVEVKCMNIFEPNLASEVFDGVVSIEAFSTMGEVHKLLETLSGLIQSGGRLVISDMFVRGKTKVKDAIDLYWKSDVFTLPELLSAAQTGSFDIVKVVDQTANKAPFWGLSAAHSRLRLADDKIAKKERSRLMASVNAQLNMKKACIKRDVCYYDVVLEKH
jgi:cyclopropane fatty-acyl-phospholipid synthase-like methyltransferase